MWSAKINASTAKYEAPDEVDPVVTLHGFPLEGDVEFTDLGAGTFKSLADLLYGPDFFSSAEVDSDDGQELIYYSVSADQARHIAEEAEKQTPGRVVIVEPIGPWCIYWWKT